MRMNIRSLIRFFFFLPFLLPLVTTDAQHLSKTADGAVGTFYTNVGQIGLTITNYGTLGTRNANWPNLPSCVYPSGSLIEHMYQGGLWVGAQLRNAQNYPIRVTTGSSDRASTSNGVGFEFTTDENSTMIERSSLANSQSFDQNAISHQDFIGDYNDTSISQMTAPAAASHQPLGIDVHQESYAWNFPFANSFVIISYTIKNINTDTLDDVYVGLWCDNVVRNTNFVRPGIGSTYFSYCGNGYDSLARMMYTYETNPSPGTVQAYSYIGVALLGSTPFPVNVSSTNDLHRQTFYNAWTYQNSSGVQALFSPTDDYNSNQYYSRYTRMSQSIPQTIIDTYVHSLQGGNNTTLLSTGPWNTIVPGDSIQVVFAVVCADNANKSLHESKDDTTQRVFLNSNLNWAQRCYSGEDANGNDTLDNGEDVVKRVPGGIVSGADGKMTRYVLPTPPAQPHVHAVVDNQKATIYWDKAAEYSRDPISGKIDFEGYHVYRTQAGADFKDNQNLTLNIPLVGDFDRSDDTIGYNTGLKKILIDTSRTFTGIRFPGDTAHYFYQFPPPESPASQLNGWQYVYGVSAYDQGDASKNLLPLESAISMVWTVSGTKPTSNPSTNIGVYPNPYYGKAYWDGTGERNRKIYFYNLPANATITIYTIAGDVVAQFDHSSTNVGTDIHWFQQFSGGQAPQFSGGEHAWDLISKYDQAIATGLYLFTVRDKDTGDVKRGRFLVIK